MIDILSRHAGFFDVVVGTYRPPPGADDDLRRYSAAYASRNGVPLEVVSKVILRHQDLKTTQIYLGKIIDSEAIRWMDNLHRI
jgi:hypothetical protein